ncbi:MAG: lipopolysaccharide biosynthesis protein RfbH, partial [Desulfobacterales bacterium]|nr:lipopolysaccharide biosynthesis protein RfbH [Desulfobacterales bacterium]
DVTLPGYNIDCDQIESALSGKTRAVMLAHTIGNPFDIARVLAFCRKHNLWLIEDCCDALGSTYTLQDQNISLQSSAFSTHLLGSFGHLSTFSFYPAHHITMGEGGAVCTNDVELKRIVESLRDWGRDCWCAPGSDNTCGRRFTQQFGELPEGYDHKYVYSHFGYNLKVTEMQAAIGCAQLEKLPNFIEARKHNWQLLREGISGLSDYFILPEPTPESDPSWFGFLLTVRENAGFKRDGIVAHLEKAGIQTRMLFAGNLIKHPCFDEMRKSGLGYRIIQTPNSKHPTPRLPATDRIMRDTFWVGIYPGMTEDMINYIIENIKKFAKTPLRQSDENYEVRD